MYAVGGVIAVGTQSARQAKRGRLVCRFATEDERTVAQVNELGRVGRNRDHKKKWIRRTVYRVSACVSGAKAAIKGCEQLNR